MPWKPFSPVEGRPPSVVVVRNRQYNQTRLLLSTPACSRTEVLVINEITGRLERGGDYATEEEALVALYPLGFQAEFRASALLGYVATAHIAGALLANKTREKGVLPGGHVVHSVVDGNWLIVPLGPLAAAAAAAGAPPGSLLPELIPADELELWKSIQSVTLDNAHYYCWTADLTRPFPSFHPAQDPEPEFVWNTWLTESVSQAGWHGRCPVLLQGAVEMSTLPSSSGVGPTESPLTTAASLPDTNGTASSRFMMALISRRSRRHPGTRYLARGLNERSGPGNEIECELVVWRKVGDGEGQENEVKRGGTAVRWARCVWRRGTVPIWWGVTLTSLQKGLAAEVYVREHDPYKGTATYFRRVQRSLARGADEGVVSMSSTSSSMTTSRPLGLDIPITCINLLHCNPAKASELMLSSHFQEGMRAVRRKLPPGAPIQVVNFDWHGNVGRLGEEKGIEGFWSFMEPFIKQTGFSCGTIMLSNDDDKNGDFQVAESVRLGPQATSNTGHGDNEQQAGITPATWWPPACSVRWEARQRGILRYNCADSLDRTNAATCFGTLPVLQEMLRRVGVDIIVPLSTLVDTSGVSSTAGNGPPHSRSLPNLHTPPALPPGWEMRWHDGRPLFIDHIHRRTQWEAPAFSPGANPRTSPGGAKTDRSTVEGTRSALGNLSLEEGDGGNADDGNADDSGHVLSGYQANDTNNHTPTAGLVPAAIDRQPSSLSPWGFFKFVDLPEVRASLRRDVLSDYAEFFRLHGDVNSFLYTGSPAMHSHVLGLLVQSGRLASGGVGKLQNLAVALQRRWNNTVSDSGRQTSLLLFLGLKVQEQFPRLRFVYTDGCKEVEEDVEDEELEIAQQLSRLEHDRSRGVLAGQSTVDGSATTVPRGDEDALSRSVNNSDEAESEIDVLDTTAGPICPFTAPDQEPLLEMDPLGAVVTSTTLSNRETTRRNPASTERRQDRLRSFALADVDQQAEQTDLLL